MASINGFSVKPYGSNALARFTIPGTSTRLSLRREVAPLMVGLAERFHRTVEPLDPKSSWGHAHRKIGGTDSWSFHAPGVAIDLNATAHPLGKRGTFSRAQVAAIRALLAAYSHQGVRLFRWGGDYRRRADEMHFEIIVPRGTALAAVRALQSPSASPPAKGHRPGTRDLRLASPRLSGEDVGYVQSWIGERRCGTADGYYGPKTRDGVNWYQGMRGLPTTGVCDRQTWRNLRVTPRY